MMFAFAWNYGRRDRNSLLLLCYWNCMQLQSANLNLSLTMWCLLSCACVAIMTVNKKLGRREDQQHQIQLAKVLKAVRGEREWGKKIKKMHQPGIEPGSVPWQGTILPLDHWCFDGSSKWSFYRRMSKAKKIEGYGNFFLSRIGLAQLHYSLV